MWMFRWISENTHTKIGWKVRKFSPIDEMVRGKLFEMIWSCSTLRMSELIQVEGMKKEKKKIEEYISTPNKIEWWKQWVDWSNKKGHVN